MQPSSSLPLQMVFRPSVPQPQHFALRLTLQHSYSSSSTAPVDGAGGAAGSGKAAASHGVNRRATTERRTSAAGSSKPGGAAAAAAAQPSESPKVLAVPVEAEGVVPKVILSRAALDFGCKVARRALQPGKSPHVFEVHLRNNTDAPLQVAVGNPAAPDTFRKPGSSHGTSRADANQQASSKAEGAASSAYTIEGWDTRPSAPFCSLGTDEALSFAVRFSPSEAKVYEACVPVYLDGSKAAPYMLVQLTGTGTLPRLTFDVQECVLPLVRGAASTPGRRFAWCCFVVPAPRGAVMYSCFTCAPAHIFAQPAYSVVNRPTFAVLDPPDTAGQLLKRCAGRHTVAAGASGHCKRIQGLHLERWLR